MKKKKIPLYSYVENNKRFTIYKYSKYYKIYQFCGYNRYSVDKVESWNLLTWKAKTLKDAKKQAIKESIPINIDKKYSVTLTKTTKDGDIINVELLTNEHYHNNITQWEMKRYGIVAPNHYQCQSQSENGSYYVDMYELKHANKGYVLQVKLNNE